MSEPFVSIITPTYNHGKFIKTCIESVLSQTYPNWEMIIIDDGSTDNTSEIVEQYNDSRVHYIKQKHRGIWKLGCTYNRALKYSEGELIAILEGDDFWPPYKLEQQIKVFKNKKVVLCWGKAGIYLNQKKRVVAIKPTNITKSRHLIYESTKKLILEGNFIPAVTVMIRRDTLQSIGGFKQANCTPYVDYPTWLELSLLGEFRALDKILGYWRIHNNQVTNTYSEHMIKSGAKLAIDFFSNHQEFLDISYQNLISNINYRISRRYYILGRQLLVANKWTQARNAFLKSLNGPIPIKIRSLVGIFFSYLQNNIEWIAKLAGKETVSVYWSKE